MRLRSAPDVARHPASVWHKLPGYRSAARDVTTMDYLDFELRVSAKGERTYLVSVVKSPAGEVSATMTFPFESLALEHHLRGIEVAVLRSASLRRDVADATTTLAPVHAFGQALFEALFTNEVQTAYRRSLDRAAAEKKGLRLRLRIDAPELSALPWEFLYDPTQRDYLCLSAGTPVVRYLESAQTPQALAVQLPLSILVMIASPTDRPSLDAANERRRMEEATADLQARGLLRITWLERSTWRDLQQEMRRGTYHIFHFVGHGGFDTTAGEGVLAFTDEAGRTALLGATEVGRLLADHGTLRLAMLNACLGAKASGTDVFSSTAATLVGRGIPAVVAMQYEISDSAAIEFSRSMYEALADELPIDAAVAEGRKAVSLAARNSAEWATPVLHMRSPDGVVFRIARTAGTPPSMSAPVAVGASTTPAAGQAPGGSGLGTTWPRRTALFAGGALLAAVAVAIVLLMRPEPDPPGPQPVVPATPTVSNDPPPVIDGSCTDPDMVSCQTPLAKSICVEASAAARRIDKRLLPPAAGTTAERDTVFFYGHAAATNSSEVEDLGHLNTLIHNVRVIVNNDLEQKSDPPLKEAPFSQFRDGSIIQSADAAYKHHGDAKLVLYALINPAREQENTAVRGGIGVVAFGGKPVTFDFELGANDFAVPRNLHKAHLAYALAQLADTDAAKLRFLNKAREAVLNTCRARTQ